ncbi:1375_t:CDS:2 [Diversispora eburnea]|uniref:Kinesin-like protein n=1 Tax=Diversispora eburnea TaxID=1213867 RepID=A0A9N8V237_9GLOM|nr:1375_t:CDS:2 [Diversispora eburnea]
MTSQGGLGTTSVQVALRIKPLTAEDIEKLPSRFQRQVITTSYTPGQVIVENEKRPIFQYDYVFGPEASQEDVYNKSVTNLLGKFLEAYGQTSSGKTYTMGTSDEASVPNKSQGIVPRTMSALFEKIKSEQYKTSKFTIKVSFIEIHNEDLIDLLGQGEEEERPPVTIREDSKGNIYWTGLQEVKVNSVEDVIKQVGFTDMNAKSSRSHAIFSVTMIHKKFVPYGPMGGPPATPPPDSTNLDLRSPSPKVSSNYGGYDEGEWETITSKFHFVDLAGSERLKRTSASGDRAKEGISINSGLLALGNVISALGDPNKARHMTHIPYRDSKLTRLLQDSLGGNAQTLMIACVSPAEYNIHETISTLNNGTISPGRITPTTPTTPNSIHTNGIRLPSSRSNSVTSLPGIPGRSTPTSNNNNSKISGRCTPTSGIPGRSTPTSGIPGRNTPTAINTGTPGRSMYNNIVNGREPVNRMRPGSPLTTFPHSNNLQTHKEKDKEVEALEEQLMLLQRSYAELSQKHAKTSAELALHQDNQDNQDNYDEMENNRNEPQGKQYDVIISTLESEHAMTKAALNLTETILQEKDEQINELEQVNEQSKSKIADLQKQIKEFEANLQKLEVENSIKIQQRADNRRESFISETVQLLEERIISKDEYIGQLEKELKEYKTAIKDRITNTNEVESKEQLKEELGDRNLRIAQLESKVNLLVDEVNKLQEMQFQEENQAGSSNSEEIIQKLREEILSLRQTHMETLKELNGTKEKYENENENLKISLENAYSQLRVATAENPPLQAFDAEQSSLLTMEARISELRKEHRQTVTEIKESKFKFQVS